MLKQDDYSIAYREWASLADLHKKLMARSDDGDEAAFKIAIEMLPELEAAHQKMTLIAKSFAKYDSSQFGIDGYMAM